MIVRKFKVVSYTMINGVNARCLSRFTEQTSHEETSRYKLTYDLVIVIKKIDNINGSYTSCALKTPTKAHGLLNMSCSYNGG